MCMQIFNPSGFSKKIQDLAKRPPTGSRPTTIFTKASPTPLKTTTSCIELPMISLKVEVYMSLNQLNSAAIISPSPQKLTDLGVHPLAQHWHLRKLQKV